MVGKLYALDNVLFKDVMANLFITTDTGVDPEVMSETGEGFVTGVASGTNFAFSTRPGYLYETENMATDALAITWNNNRTFVAKATHFSMNGESALSSDEPVTFELSGDGIKYYRSEEGILRIGAASQPSTLLLNGIEVQHFRYDKRSRMVQVEVPAGEGELVIR